MAHGEKWLGLLPLKFIGSIPGTPYWTCSKKWLKEWMVVSVCVPVKDWRSDWDWLQRPHNPEIRLIVRNEWIKNPI